MIIIEISVAGYRSTAMIDSGASISVIDETFLRKTCKSLPRKVDYLLQKSCVLAEGTNILLDTQICLPIKLRHVTIEADLFVLPMKHVSVILGCDLLNLLNARIDFRTKKLIVQNPALVFLRIQALNKSALGTTCHFRFELYYYYSYKIAEN